MLKLKYIIITITISVSTFTSRDPIQEPVQISARHMLSGEEYPLNDHFTEEAIEDLNSLSFDKLTLTKYSLFTLNPNYESSHISLNKFPDRFKKNVIRKSDDGQYYIVNSYTETMSLGEMNEYIKNCGYIIKLHVDLGQIKIELKHGLDVAVTFIEVLSYQLEHNPTFYIDIKSINNLKTSIKTCFSTILSSERKGSIAQCYRFLEKFESIFLHNHINLRLYFNNLESLG